MSTELNQNKIFDNIKSSATCGNVKIPKWAMNEEIVISGISGRYPESDNVEEFSKHLYENIDMVVENEKRWPFGYLGLPKCTGTIKDISKFDAEFFGISEKEANLMDPQLRMVLETAYEAIWDSGIDPNTLNSTNTGTFVGSCWDDVPSAHAEDYTKVVGYKQNFSGIVSNAFNLAGPSKVLDTACGSSMTAFHEAIVSLRSNECERAIVVGVNVCTRAGVQFLFYRLNMISPDGHCMCLDAKANGYAKGEACVVAILQKRSEAKRVYASVAHTKSNCDGYVDLGITFPSWELQRDLMRDTCIEAGINPLSVEYIEGHCTGTQAGDVVEMKAIQHSMCNGSREPLLIGALKSNIGHTEGASGLCAITKVILSFENQCIPANLHFSEPNPEIEGLMSGQLKPINENTPFNGRFVGLNGFGYGGANVHVILESIGKELTPNNNDLYGKIPRLVNMCGRSIETLKYFIDSLISEPKKMTRDMLSLINDISKTSPTQTNTSISPMNYRGFTIFEDKDQNITSNNVEINEVSSDKRQIWFIFSGMGSQWTAMAKSLINIEIFERSLKASAKVLKKFNINLLNILLNDKYPISTPLLSFVSIVSIQIAFIDLLNELNIKPDGYIGHSIGDLACAYADRCLTAEQTILFAYYRGKCIEEAKLKPGLMAATGLEWAEAQRLCPNGVYAACHNAEDSVTISGDYESVQSFLSKLSSDDIFNRKVDSNGIAYHTPSLSAIIDPLSSALKNIDSSQKTISSKWLSTTYSEDIISNNKNQFYLWKYFVDNLINPVLFYDAIKQIPRNSVVIEISPHSLLEPIIKRTLGSNISYLSLMKKNNDNNINLFLTSIGKLYTFGFNPLIEKLYPKVDYPVSRGTPMISPLIKWKHEKAFTVYQYPDYFDIYNTSIEAVTIDLKEKEDMYIKDHCIDGRILYPAAGYLILVWKNLAKSYGVDYDKLPVVFKDVRLHRATILSKTGVTKFSIRIMKTNGSFVVIENDSEVVTGIVYVPKHIKETVQYRDVFEDIMEQDLFSTETLSMETKDVYKELRLRGYDYGPTFRNITKAVFNKEKVSASIKWTNNFVTFIDCMLQLSMFSKNVRGLYLPVRFERLSCDPILFYSEKLFIGNNEPEIPVVLDFNLKIGVTKGIEFRGLKASLVPRRMNAQIPVVECYRYVANHDQNALDDNDSQYLHKYLNTCNTVAVNVAKKYLKYGRVTLESACNTSEDDMFKTEEKSYLLQFLNDLNEKEILNEKNITEFLSSTKIEKIINEDMLTEAINKESFLRPLIDLVMENLKANKINILEANTTSSLVSPVISNFNTNIDINCSLLHPSLVDLPQALLQSMQTYELIADKTNLPLDLNNKIDLVIYKDISISHYLASKCFINLQNLFESLRDTVKVNGFILVLCKDNVTFAEEVISKILNTQCFVSRNQEIIKEAEKCGFVVIANRFDTVSINAILLRKVETETQLEKQTFIHVNNEYESWIKQLQESMTNIENKPNDENIWLISDKQPTNGLIGLINCIRREPNGHRLRCILHLADKKLNESLIKSLVKLDLAINVIKEGNVGTFRHLRINSMPKPVRTEHCFINIQTKGDLSSLKWFESEHKYWPIGKKLNQVLCNVYYAPLNFKDIMLATGKLPADALPEDQALQDCVLGLEFAGRDQNGNRVMGLVPSKGLATTIVLEDISFLWPIPDHWSMEEASTVPVAYATAYYALIIRGKLKRKEKVLIHSGSGAVGQAAINICLSLDCDLFVTVGSDIKREFLMKEFPKLNEKNFANSRDISFETLVMNATNGRGVDIVLNSLAEEKLQASVRCLAINGRFLEIGKFDLSQNSILNVSNLIRNKTFHGIFLDTLMSNDNNSPKITRDKKLLFELIRQGIKSGTVKPMERTIFDIYSYEDAFRYMASGKHMGKVVIKIRDEESGGIGYKTIRNLAIPRTVFYANKSYIIIGGIGGFGLELANWMIDRGVMNLILTSRRGPTEPYQHYRLKDFVDKGIQVIVSKIDASTLTGAEELLKEAQLIGPIGGIFNLALVLSDCLFENMTPEIFETVCAPKADATRNLDVLSRNLSPKVDYFVCFSSVACGRGNAGQSNYGYANSVMERVCESRRDNGYHGLAIQWGAIGDVGYVIEHFQGNDIVIGGTVMQRMPSCLLTLDQLFQSQYSVCSSIVVADLNADAMGKKESLIKRVEKLMGVKDITSLAPNTTLVELGMDSLIAVELKQTLERDYDLVLSLQDIRKLNLAKLAEISDAFENNVKSDVKTNNDKTNLTSDNYFNIPTESIIQLNEIRTGEPVFIIPPIEGNFDVLREIAIRLNRPAIGINWTYECKSLKSIEEAAQYFLTVINKNCSINNNFDIIGYSFGGGIAFEMGIELERQSKNLRKLVLLESSPQLLKTGTIEGISLINVGDEEGDRIDGLVSFLAQYSTIDYQKVKTMLQNTPKEERAEKVSQIFRESTGVSYDPNTISFAAETYFNKLKMMHFYSTENVKYNGDILLIRAADDIVNDSTADDNNLPPDYGLSEISSGKLDVITIDGNHKTFLSDNYKQVVGHINTYLAQ